MSDAAPKRSLGEIAGVAGGLLGLALLPHLSPLLHGALLGAPRTDVLRGVWGLALQARAFPTPWWTDDIGFPFGVKALVLPVVSSALGAPLVWIFGPIQGYNLWVLLLWWLTALSFAGLAWRLTRSAPSALVAGAASLLQPMLLLAITDGTPEHLALWSLPLACWALLDARRTARWGPALAAGALCTITALDSPYHAFFAIPFCVVSALWGPLTASASRTALWGLLKGTPALAAGVGLLALAYVGLPLEGRAPELGANAVKIGVWQQWEARGVQLHGAQAWDSTFTPTFFPSLAAVALAAVALLRPRRAAPWLLLTGLCLAMGVGPAEENTAALARIAGGAGRALGQAAHALSEAVVVPGVRFPRWWLVPAVHALGLAAALGLSRLRAGIAPWAAALALVAGLAYSVDTQTAYRASLSLSAPRPSVFSPPAPAFVTFVRDHPLDGAVVFLPQIRSASRLHERDELPVFASLGQDLASGDLYLLHALIGRPMLNMPQGLMTMTWRKRPDAESQRLYRDLDDLTQPYTSGNPLPPSAIQEPERRAAAAEALVRAGLRFVVLDDDIFRQEGLEIGKRPFAGLLREERHFSDGTGVTVWVVAPRDAAPSPR